MKASAASLCGAALVIAMPETFIWVPPSVKVG